MSEATSTQDLVQSRRRVLQEIVGRPLLTPMGISDTPLVPARREHLLDELRELYWNDLEWENVTEEERMEGGSIPELTFPGVLALTRGILLTEVAADSLGEAEPRPEIVEEFLHFLAQQILDLGEKASGEPSDDGDRAALDLRMTEGLLDRVLMEYHRLSPEDVGTLDEA
ncbi:MAG: hypothetical protein WD056_01335 [Gemmatimonadota bacterium]